MTYEPMILALVLVAVGLWLAAMVTGSMLKRGYPFVGIVAIALGITLSGACGKAAFEILMRQRAKKPKPPRRKERAISLE